jgi:hypothetical protein
VLKLLAGRESEQGLNVGLANYYHFTNGGKTLLLVDMVSTSN